MRPMQLDREQTLFAVEGHLERNFLSQNCKGLHNIRIGVQGVAVSAEAIAKQLESQWRLRLGHFRNLVVVLDREGRQQSSSEFSKHLEGLLYKHCEGVSVVIVGCPDRMIENWIIADHEVVADYLGHAFPKYEGDGKSGKAMLKAVFRSAGRTYFEVADGVTLLKKSRIPKIVRSSASAREFFSRCAIDCWWLLPKGT
jgi:hypothetical protein